MTTLRLALVSAFAAAALCAPAQAAADPVTEAMLAGMQACEAAHKGGDLSAFVRRAGYEADGEHQGAKAVGEVDMILTRDQSANGSSVLEFCTIAATTRSVDTAQITTRLRGQAPGMGLTAQPARSTTNGGQVTPFENIASADIVSYALVVFAPDEEFSQGYASVNLIWRAK